jgi:2,5-furandicarboxylate decarboxylase 1
VTAWPQRADLRGWLERRREEGLLVKAPGEIDPRFELAGVLSRLDGERAVLFERVRGTDMRVVGNTVLGRGDLAAVLGCEVRDTAEAFRSAVTGPRPYEQVEPGAAPVLERRLESEAGLDALPAPVHHERDGGRYISAGVVVARDPTSGLVNLSINRLQVTGPRELRALVLPGRLRQILADTEQAGEPLDVAILIGVDPTVVLASQARPGRDADDLEICSAMRHQPVRVAGAPETGLPIVADAELLIEARLQPGRQAEEGPFGEFPHTYSPAAPGPVLDVLAIHHRAEPIFQTILSGGREHLLVGGIPRESDLLYALRQVSEKVSAVRMTDGGSLRFHAVVALDDPTPNEARAVLEAAFASNAVIKHAVAVNGDVDVFDAEQLEWALATRVQGASDLIVLEDERGSPLDPSTHDGRTAKVGVDATVPTERLDEHRWMKVPGAEKLDLDTLVVPA